MNLRKFYLLITVIVSAFLFIAGASIIYFINSNDINISASSNSPLTDFLLPFMHDKDPFNVLVLGGDKVNKNSDTMMLVNFDPETLKINIMSIPRDTKVKINNRTHKINYAYPNGGIELTVKTVSELLNVKIKYYVFVDTEAFRNIIDLLDGVDIEVPPGMDYDDPTQDLHIHLQEGLQHLNGEQAEQFVRFRHPNHWPKKSTREYKELIKYYDGSDLKRIQAQQKFINELIRQKLTIQYLPKLNSIINVIFDNTETNFTLNKVVNLSSFISKLRSENIKFLSLPGAPLDVDPWYYICDIDQARELAKESFKCNDSFVDVEIDSSKYNNQDDQSTQKRKSYTKGNPSNGGSTIKKTKNPEP